MLRMESANQEIDGRPLPPLGEDARPKYRQGFGKDPGGFIGCHSMLTQIFRLDLLKVWVEDNLDLYKVRRSPPDFECTE